MALILALGISGVTICIFCAPFAWNMASATLRRMQKDGISDSWERTLVQLARYLGIIGTAVLAVAVFFFLLLRASR